MKKLLVLGALVGLFFAFQPAQADAPGDKVEVCHVNGSVGAFMDEDVFPVPIYFGRVISVSPKAAEKFVERGDGINFIVLEEADYDALDAIGFDYGNSTCAFWSWEW